MKFFAAAWGTLGVTLLVGKSCQSLFHRANEALHMDLATWQWIFLVLYAIFMLVVEGHRGFKKKFSPRTASRVLYLYHNPKPIDAILAPFFCMGYFHATKKAQITAIVISTLILAVIFLMRFCPQPWRGIIDVGVILGLSYGLIWFYIFIYLGFKNKKYPHNPNVPHGPKEGDTPKSIA